MSGDKPDDKQASGVGVDRFGNPVVDPTENVIALTEAANKRQDDLRKLNDRRIDAEIKILAVTLEGIEKRMILRADHAKEIRDSESRRLDAIRQVDVLAGNTAAERQLVAIQTLAAQSAGERETLRSLVESKAQALALQNTETVAQQNSRIAQLEKSSYEGAGKGTGAKNLYTIIALGVGLLVTLFMAALTVGGIIVAIAYAIRR